jgi:hypothetical protein
VSEPKAIRSSEFDSAVNVPSAGTQVPPMLNPVRAVDELDSCGAMYAGNRSHHV